MLQAVRSSLCKRVILPSTFPIASLHVSSSTPDKYSILDTFTSALGKVESSGKAHSQLLTSQHSIYELQRHDVIPGQIKAYTDIYKEVSEKLSEFDFETIDLCGSFWIEVGEQDRAVHLWKYKNYMEAQRVVNLWHNDPFFIKIRDERAKLLLQRRNEMCMKFGFWPTPDPREPARIYEMRTYTLKPGMLIEWGNHWARGITYREKFCEPITGLFTQLGKLYVVHHIWAYKDLSHREECRNIAWQNQGWDKLVANTVPLIRHMETRIMMPMEFSRLQ